MSGGRGPQIPSKTRSELWQRAGVAMGDASARERIDHRDAGHGAPAIRGALGAGLLAVGGSLLALFLLWAAAGTYAHVSHEQGAVTLRESILAAADQCYAVEGAYPPSLSRLEEDYGLWVNHEGYDVLYEAFASNVAPTVVVKAL